MNINFTKDLTTEETNLLMDIFNCDEVSLQGKITELAMASTQEYLDMVLGKRVFTRGQDMKEYKLFLLIKYFFGGFIPDEQTITTMFQTTTTESKSLLRSVMAKYQYELKESINNTIKNVLENEVDFDEVKDVYKVSKIGLNIVDEMNNTLSQINGSLSQVNKKRGASHIFEIPAASYEELCTHFNINLGEDDE